tara:strand:+ start:496 stop:636 length:141 start_codon:yes stop_codon:yes gene_type:complete
MLIALKEPDKERLARSAAYSVERKKQDEWWENALKRVNEIGKPKHE